MPRQPHLDAQDYDNDDHGENYNHDFNVFDDFDDFDGDGYDDEADDNEFAKRDCEDL